MNALRNAFLSLAALSTTLCVPTYGRVAIRLLHPSAASPQAIGTPVTWTARATDSGAGPLTFRVQRAISGRLVSGREGLQCGIQRVQAVDLSGFQLGANRRRRHLSGQSRRQRLWHRTDRFEDQGLPAQASGDRQHSSGCRHRQSAGTALQRALLRERQHHAGFLPAAIGIRAQHGHELGAALLRAP